MIKISELLSGAKLLEVKHSKHNGDLSVIKSIAWGTYISGGGLTQSGGIAQDIWKKPLKRVASLPAGKVGSKKPSSILILGLGGGGIIPLLRENWLKAKITGVDIDPEIIRLGKKYLGFDGKNVEVVVSEAGKFLKKVTKENKFTPKNERGRDGKYDLVIVDLYVGDVYPKEFESENYIHLVRSVLTSGGVAVFNRLYFGEKRTLAQKFLKKLENNFKEVEVVYPEANVMFICKT